MLISDLNNLSLNDEEADAALRNISDYILYVIILFIFSLIQGLRKGFGASDYKLLSISSIILILINILYIQTFLDKRKTFLKSDIFGVLISLIGEFIPYLFFMYLIIFRGCYSLYHLIHHFSWIRLLSSIIFILLGYKAIERISFLQILRKVMKKKYSFSQSKTVT